MADADSGLDFKDVGVICRGSCCPGRLRLHPKAVMFKFHKSGKIDQYDSNDICEVQWMKASRGYQLVVITNSNSVIKFIGLDDKNKDEIKKFVKNHYNAVFVEKEPFVKGWNWGSADFNGPLLTFQNDSKPIFEIPLSDVSTATVNKNEVTLEFHQDDDNDLNLVEMRFYVPQVGEEIEDQAEMFHKSVMKYADVIQATGDVIVKFGQVLLQTPRGRYDIDMYPTFLRLHGKSYDYKIPYSTIIRLFLLPHNDNRSVYFVITTDPPIRQGQTRYPHIVIQFNKDDWSDLTLELDEDTIAQKYDGKLQKEMAGPTYETFSKVMKSVVGQKIFVPGTFQSSKGNQAVACSHKANAGHLYPLEKGFMYVVKPPVHIRFDEVVSVNFSRVASGVGQNRSFDLEIETKSSTNYVFASIEKQEYSKLFDFMKAKNIRIQNNKGDENFQDDFGDDTGSDQDEMPDHYLEKMKAEGKERDSDETSSSEDADFVAGETPDTSPSSSSSGDEGDGKKKKKVAKETEIRSKEKKKKEKTAPKRKADKKADRKALKDPNKPKKPPTAYFLWLADNRNSIKEEHPGISVTEIAKKAGEMWRTIETDERQKYEDNAGKLKKEYDEAMKEYNKQQAKNPYVPPLSKSSTKSKASSEKTTYKSKATVDTDEDLSTSTDEESKKKTSNKRKREESKNTSPPSSSKSKEKAEESNEESDDHDVRASESESEDAKSPPPKRSMRKHGKAQAPKEDLPDDMSDLAEFTDGEEPVSSSSNDSD